MWLEEAEGRGGPGSPASSISARTNGTGSSPRSECLSQYQPEQTEQVPVPGQCAYLKISQNKRNRIKSQCVFRHQVHQFKRAKQWAIFSVLWIRNDLFRTGSGVEFVELWILPMLYKHIWKGKKLMINQESKRRIYAESGTNTVLPDPGQSSGSDRSRIHNTDFC